MCPPLFVTINLHTKKTKWCQNSRNSEHASLFSKTDTLLLPKACLLSSTLYYPEIYSHQLLQLTKNTAFMLRVFFVNKSICRRASKNTNKIYPEHSFCFVFRVCLFFKLTFGRLCKPLITYQNLAEQMYTLRTYNALFSYHFPKTFEYLIL